MYQYKAVVTNVVDGDTVDATVDVGFNIFLKLRFRLYGINTPELHHATMPEALKSKIRVEELLLNKQCMVNTYKPDKYGRWLGVFTVQDAQGVSWDVNQLLLAEGLAVPYME